MPTYSYQVRDDKGKKTKGTSEAVSEKALADRLESDGFLVTSIKQRRGRGQGPSVSEVLTRSPVSMGDITMLYFQLGNMLEGGVALLAALRTVVGQIDNKTLRKTVLDVGVRVERGESFSDALASHAKLFPLVYRTMVQVGETSGNLAQVLQRVAELNERREDLAHQVKSALAYPIVLMIACIAVVVFMMVWIVPSFVAIFSRAEVELPLPTRMVYGTSLWMKANWLLLLGSFVGTGAAFSFALKVDGIKLRWDRFLLSWPVVGQLLSRVEISRWSQSVALMLSSGVPILTTLEVTSRITGNRAYQEALDQARKSVQEGESLAETLRKGGLFPPDIVQMISTGEQSGSIDKVLYKAAHYYDQLIRRSIKNLTAAIEPFFILLMGATVGFIMVSIMLPIFDLLKLFSG